MDFIDLKAQQKLIRKSLEERFRAVLDHGRYILGPEVSELEDRLARFVGVDHCISVSSGTDALIVSLLALGVGSGDEVITTPFSFIATAEAILLLGAKPVFIDIEEDTFNLDPAHLEAAIGPRTKAIIPVSLFGQCGDIDEINAIAHRHNITVIEDAAQSFGATYKGKRSCGITTIGCTSFFPSKPLGCYGDGGACFTDDALLAEKMRQLRVHGQKKRYHHNMVGINGRLDTLQAAILLEKLQIFPEEIALRQEIAERYGKLLRDLEKEGHLKLPETRETNTSVFAQYTVRMANRDEIARELQAQGIPTAVHYPIPLHRQPVFKFCDQALPVAEQAAREVLSLPMHPYLSERDQQRIASVLGEAVAILSQADKG